MKRDMKGERWLLCEVDHLTSELAGLELRRSGTLAAGAPRCDFRYYRR